MWGKCLSWLKVSYFCSTVTYHACLFGWQPWLESGPDKRFVIIKSILLVYAIKKNDTDESWLPNANSKWIWCGPSLCQHHIRKKCLRRNMDTFPPLSKILAVLEMPNTLQLQDWTDLDFPCALPLTCIVVGVFSPTSSSKVGCFVGMQTRRCMVSSLLRRK